MQFEKDQGLDELGRRHGGDAVVLAKVASGPPVDSLLLFGLVGILKKRDTGGKTTITSGWRGGDGGTTQR